MNYERIRKGIHANFTAGKYRDVKAFQTGVICGEIQRRKWLKERNPSKTPDTCADLRKKLA